MNCYPFLNMSLSDFHRALCGIICVLVVLSEDGALWRGERQRLFLGLMTNMRKCLKSKSFAGRSSGCWNKRWTKSAWKTQGKAYAFESAAKTEHLKVPLPPPLTSTPLLPKALSMNAPQLFTLVQVPNSSKNAAMVT